MDTQGLSINSHSEVEQPFGFRGSFRKGLPEQVSAACAGLIRFAVITIPGDGARALGYRQKNRSVHLYDPNKGILQFNGSQEFAKWFPAYLAGEYANRLMEVRLTKVRA